MEEKYRIKIGDVVSVHFHGAQSTLSHSAEVISTPVDDNDTCWVFEDLDNGKIHHISERCTVTRLLTP